MIFVSCLSSAVIIAALTMIYSRSGVIFSISSIILNGIFIVAIYLFVNLSDIHDYKVSHIYNILSIIFEESYKFLLALLFISNPKRSLMAASSFGIAELAFGRPLAFEYYEYDIKLEIVSNYIPFLALFISAALMHCITAAILVINRTNILAALAVNIVFHTLFNYSRDLYGGDFAEVIAILEVFVLFLVFAFLVRRIKIAELRQQDSGDTKIPGTQY